MEISEFIAREMISRYIHDAIDPEVFDGSPDEIASKVAQVLNIYNKVLEQAESLK